MGNHQSNRENLHHQKYWNFYHHFWLLWWCEISVSRFMWPNHAFSAIPYSSTGFVLRVGCSWLRRTVNSADDMSFSRGIWGRFLRMNFSDTTPHVRKTVQRCIFQNFWIKLGSLHIWKIYIWNATRRRQERNAVKATIHGRDRWDRKGNNENTNPDT